MGLTKAQAAALEEVYSAAEAADAPKTPAKAKAAPKASSTKSKKAPAATGEPPAKKCKADAPKADAVAAAADKAVLKKVEKLSKESKGKKGKKAALEQKHLRLADVAEEPLAALGPIVGVMKVPRVSLTEAAVQTGVEHMDACGFMAAENGASLADEDEHGLDKDLAGALNLYTMESQLYPELNARLRGRDRPRLRPFFPLLKLLLLARERLPKFDGTVWRGVKADLRAQYPKGKEVYWWAFSSTTKELSTLTNPMFLGVKGCRTIFNIQVRSGVDIMKYSAYQGTESEAEVLLFPGTKLKVVDTMNMGHGLFQVHLQEVDVPVQLMK